MINNLLHKSRILLSKFRTVTTGKKRSAKWRTVEKNFIEENPLCEACGSHKNLQVHHIKPFHLYPELELDTNNLITLCMDKLECHLRIGHGSSWRAYNPSCKEDANKLKKDISQFNKIAAEAKLQRLKA